MAREVAEESGVEVGDVSVVGSQPWPVGMLSATCMHAQAYLTTTGRGGSCELMIGAMARARDERITINTVHKDLTTTASAYT